MICWSGANTGADWHGGVVLFGWFVSPSCWSREKVEVPRKSSTPEDDLNNDGRTNKETGGGALFFSLH